MRRSSLLTSPPGIRSAAKPIAACDVVHVLRSYRCHYHPNDRNGFPAACDTGVLPIVQVKARDAEHAQRIAHQLTGCSISNVERIDEAAA